jgi:protein-L-isoaspartate(D-aspartate) O-methyltransferase
LQQLRPNGIMVIPVGPPGQQMKQQGEDDSIRVARSNIYNKIVPLVPFAKLDGEAVNGPHDGRRRG